MPRNEIISRRLRPTFLFLSVFAIVCLLGVAGVSKKASVDFKFKKESIVKVDIFFVSFIALTFISIALFTYKGASDFTSETIKKYLDKEIEKNPDLEQFRSLLQNPRVLKNITTFISNELSHSEQKRIVYLMREVELASTNEQIDNIHNEIIKVINEHRIFNSEFDDRVCSALVHESYLMYVKQKQAKNSAMLRQSKTK